MLTCGLKLSPPPSKGGGRSPLVQYSSTIDVVKGTVRSIQRSPCAGEQKAPRRAFLLLLPRQSSVLLLLFHANLRQPLPTADLALCGCMSCLLSCRTETVQSIRDVPPSTSNKHRAPPACSVRHSNRLRKTLIAAFGYNRELCVGASTRSIPVPAFSPRVCFVCSGGVHSHHRTRRVYLLLCFSWTITQRTLLEE